MGGKIADTERRPGAKPGNAIAHVRVRIGSGAKEPALLRRQRKLSLCGALTILPRFSLHRPTIFKTLASTPACRPAPIRFKHMGGVFDVYTSKTFNNPIEAMEFAMQTVQVTVIRLFQLIVTLFFTFIVMLYVGALTLMPLAVLLGIIHFFTGIGFNAIFATLLSAIILAIIVSIMAKIPRLFALVVDIGWSLTKQGAAVFRQMDDMARSIKGTPADRAALAK